MVQAGQDRDLAPEPLRAQRRGEVRMQHLQRDIWKHAGALLQAEDEIAGIGAAVGASFAGRKAMTATSGPGFSLKTEMLGLASVTELPLV